MTLLGQPGQSDVAGAVVAASRLEDLAELLSTISRRQMTQPDPVYILPDGLEALGWEVPGPAQGRSQVLKQLAEPGQSVLHGAAGSEEKDQLLTEPNPELQGLDYLIQICESDRPQLTLQSCSLEWYRMQNVTKRAAAEAVWGLSLFVGGTCAKSA
jgi:hypothetical protein